GQVTLSTDPGTFQFQADYGGAFFDSDPCTVPGCKSATVQIQKPVQVTVDDGYGGTRPDVHLAAVDTDGNEVTWTTTDDFGQASFYMPPGAYLIRAEASDGTTFDSGESGSCVIPGCTSATISITDVMVTVTYSDGSPVTDQRVTAVMSDGTEVDWPNSGDQGQADEFVAAGAYKFEVVVNGNAYDSGPDGHCVVPGCRTATIVVGGGCSGQPDGTACDDGSACTQTDTCQGGACMGGNSVTCVASDQCHSAGTCDPASGTCSNPAKTDGTACNDGNACTQSDICQNGACTGGNPVICTAQDQCHLAGTCNPSTGTCSTPAAANGTACNDGNACTQTDICQSGTCTGGNSVTCTASDQCHGVGSCNQSTGVCSNPTLTNGTTCNDGNACTTGETCQ